MKEKHNQLPLRLPSGPDRHRKPERSVAPPDTRKSKVGWNEPERPHVFHPVDKGVLTYNSELLGESRGASDVAMLNHVIAKLDVCLG
jgi:hypothetical protein